MRVTRTITYSVVEDGCLRRDIRLSDGRTYTHHCTKEVYETVAYAVEDGQPHTGQELSRTLTEPFTQVDLAFQFLKDRGILEVGRKRKSHASGKCVYEDAMVEYCALKELGPIAHYDSGGP
jgi:hypothetical protein